MSNYKAWAYYASPTSGQYVLPPQIEPPGTVQGNIDALIWEHWCHPFWADGTVNIAFQTAVGLGMYDSTNPKTAPWMDPTANSQFAAIGAYYPGPVYVPYASANLWTWGLPTWFYNAVQMMNIPQCQLLADQKDAGWEQAMISGRSPPPPPPPPGMPLSPLSPGQPPTPGSPWSPLGPGQSFPKPKSWPGGPTNPTDDWDWLPIAAFGAVGLAAYALGKKL